VIADLREKFNASYEPKKYQTLLRQLDLRAGTKVEFRVAETPVFLPLALLEEMAWSGVELTQRLLRWPEYLAAAQRSIPEAYRVAGGSEHPNFLTADFALVEAVGGELVPRLVEIQAFPSVFAYQAMLSEEYRRVFGLSESLGIFLSGLNAEGFWALFRKTVLGEHAAETCGFD
jgi:hypothetical protein